MSNGQRIVPTRAGWWWARWTRWLPDGIIFPMEVVGDFVDGLIVHEGDFRADSPDITWLAPIPGPDVCAALADVTRELDGYDAGESPFGRLGNARTALTNAIRAERDGAA